MHTYARPKIAQMHYGTFDLEAILLSSLSSACSFKICTIAVLNMETEVGLVGLVIFPTDRGDFSRNFKSVDC